jgi:hypothetical protein
VHLVPVSLPPSASKVKKETAVLIPMNLFFFIISWDEGKKNN